MYISYFMFSILTLSALADPVQHPPNGNECGQLAKAKDARKPSWGSDDQARIVPLTDAARRGAIDFVTEEGLISLIGSRFANPLYKNSGALNGNTTAVFPLNAGKIIAKIMPCLWNANKNMDVRAALKCGVSAKEIRSIAEWLPGPMGRWVQQNLCAKSLVDDDDDGGEGVSPYVDWVAIGARDISILAFRGDLYEYQLQELKGLNKRASIGSPATSACAVGSECADCKCCVGVCADDACIGACAI